MSGLPAPNPAAPNPAQTMRELSIPWLIIYTTDPNAAWRSAARAELARRLNRLVYAPIRAELLNHRNLQVRTVVTEIFELPASPVVPATTNPQDEGSAPGALDNLFPSR